ncbi:response regulator [Lacinutrix salivirga]
MDYKLNSILLIDDSKATNFLNKTIAKKFQPDLNILVAENGEDALQLLNQDHIHPEIIFLDINMPVLNGWEFLEKFKKTKTYSPLIVIMLGEQLEPKHYTFLKENYKVSMFAKKIIKKEDFENFKAFYFNTNKQLN